MKDFESQSQQAPATDRAGKPPVINQETIESIRSMQDADDPNLLQEMIIVYIRSARVQIGQLNTLSIESDTAAIQKTAHSLKGSSASIGATGLAACSLAMETMTKEGSHDRYPSILKILNDEAEATFAALLLECEEKAA